MPQRGNPFYPKGMLRRAGFFVGPLFTRSITSRGQFNPIHDFSECLAEGCRAHNEEEFTRVITNPGPIRVGYSPDYLDWLYRAYQSKVQYNDDKNNKQKAEQRLQSTPAGESPQSQSQSQSRIGGGMDEGQLPGVPPPGQFLRPPHSRRRLVGEAKRREAQQTLDEISKKQGLLDLFERQPQFPVIHIDKAKRFHVVELFKELVLDRAFDPVEIWDKALLYRAILSERQATYPKSFRYVFDAVDQTVFASSATGATEGGGGGHLSVADRCPSEEDYRYFLFLVKRYYVDNAVEGHVVLRCCREPNMADLLFSNPPPRDEQEVRASIQSAYAGDKASSNDIDAGNRGNPTRVSPGEGSLSTPKRGNRTKGAAEAVAISTRPPARYPPIACLWQCEENLPLLTVLVFGELNLMVSENPFVKYPNAQSFLTRPYAEEEALRGTRGAALHGLRDTNNIRSSGGGQRWDRDAEVVSLANIIAEKRRHLNLANIPYTLATALDGRANDLRRLQQRYHREDVMGFQKLMRSASELEDSSVNYLSFSDWSYFNPNAVRAEVRDQLQRRGLEALKLYDEASKDLYRVSFEEAEMSSMNRHVEGVHTFPSYIPTMPHFIALIMKDPHVACLLHVVLSDSDPHASGKRRELQRLAHQLGNMLHQMALEFHKEDIRRVNKQKVNVAATLLDNFVRDELRRLDAKAEDWEGVKALVRRLGDFRPFEGRLLDESGFTTDARVEDYARWMAPPTAA